MNVAAHQFSGRSIDHPVSFHRRHPVEGGSGNRHVKMAAFARAGMPRVFGAVVTDVEQRRVQCMLERGAQPLDAGCAHGVPSLANSWLRNSQTMTPSDITMPSGPAIQTLKETQSLSLRLNAIQMFATPSSR